MHRASPPTPRGGGRVRSTSRGSSERPPLTARSGNTSLSPLAATFQPGTTLSMARPASKAQPRNASSSPRLVQALLNSQAGVRARADLPPLHIEQIESIYPQAIPRKPLSAGAGRYPQMYLPTGYQSVPMSRDVSRESDSAGAVSDAGNAPNRAFSDPDILGFNTTTAQHTSPEYASHLSFTGVGEWANIPPTQPGPGSVQFGSMDPLSLSEARARAAIAREASNERGRGRSRGTLPADQAESASRKIEFLVGTFLVDTSSSVLQS